MSRPVYCKFTFAGWEWEVTLTGGVAASKVFAAAFARANFFAHHVLFVCGRVGGWVD